MLRHPFSFPNILGNKKQSTKPSTSTRKSLLIFGGQWFENGDKFRVPKPKAADLEPKRQFGNSEVYRQPIFQLS